MGIKEVLSAPRSPRQRAYVERVIGSIRRERLDDRVRGSFVVPARELVPGLLSSIAHSSLVGEGCTGVAGRPGAGSRASLPFRNSAAFIIAMNVARPEARHGRFNTVRAALLIRSYLERRQSKSGRVTRTEQARIPSQDADTFLAPARKSQASWRQPIQTRRPIPTIGMGSYLTRPDREFRNGSEIWANRRPI